jgi:MYXO-CTERM domain-containing protein
MTFTDVKGIRPCLKDACETECEFKAGLTVWPPETCDPPTPPPPMRKTGCGCAVGSDAAVGTAVALALTVFAAAVAAHIRRGRR